MAAPEIVEVEPSQLTQLKNSNGSRLIAVEFVLPTQTGEAGVDMDFVDVGKELALKVPKLGYIVGMRLRVAAYGEGEDPTTGAIYLAQAPGMFDDTITAADLTVGVGNINTGYATPAADADMPQVIDYAIGAWYVNHDVGILYVTPVLDGSFNDAQLTITLYINTNTNSSYTALVQS